MDLSSNCTTNATYVRCFFFLGVGKGFVWDRDLVCVSGGCMVWNSIISLFMAYFWLCLEWDSSYYIVSSIYYLCAKCRMLCLYTVFYLFTLEVVVWSVSHYVDTVAINCYLSQL